MEEEPNTPIRIITCCERGDLVGLQQLCTDHADLAFTDRDGFSPLLTAIYNYQNHIVHFLLMQPSLDIERVSNRYKSNALHVAAYKRNLDALYLVLQHCKKNNLLEKLVNQPDKWGKTPLHHVVYHGFTEGIRLLLDQKEVDRQIKDYNHKVPMDYIRCELDATLFL